MSKVLPYRTTVIGKATEGLVLVYNSANNAKIITVDGHMLGGKEKAWVSEDDRILLLAIESGAIKLVWDGKVSKAQQVQEAAGDQKPTIKAKKRLAKKSAPKE